MQKKSETLNRNSLYREVWENPISTLSPKYGLSDVGLKKICKALNVPTPPRGYWAKVQNIIRVEKTPLPKLKPGQSTAYTIRKYEFPNSPYQKEDEKISDEASEIISTLIAGRPYTVSERLASPHLLVAEALAQLSKAETDKYGILVGPWKKTHIDIRVSQEMLGRALRMMDSIIKFFESEVLNVSVDKGDSSRDTHIKLFNEKVSFFIREPSQRYDYELTTKEKEDLKRNRHSFAEKYDYKPTGVLSLEINTYGAENIRKRFADGKNNHVEDYLLDFMISVVKVADIFRTERNRREAEQKRWEEERERLAEIQRQQEIENQRLRELENQADRWFKSNRLREYIKTVETVSSQKELSEGEKTIRNKWIEWAKAHANRLDPLSDGMPFEIE